ncbi:(E)-4-hydroxy-3-methylbut-2-enyl-diphosphate synthase [Falsiporphyromonas endometrii]|uniref:4-hydroxy-3-methylbut-2-en-1-yl diphosphate synthase (flavodoxin) n=1 Tax=Falsiporphyromonas endometrii TaxID=1387297 RepID=A0ABV9K919_9PORP
MTDLFNYKRRHSLEVKIGNLSMGGDHAIRIQSMCNTSTMDTISSVEQCIGLFDAGADLVRLTAQGVREADNLGNIRSALIKAGYPQPLVADIHFNPKAAHAALKTVEKVRINPGNFADNKSSVIYNDEQFAKGAERVQTRFGEFLDDAASLDRAIRIGVNHGSLSERMLQRYGDTAEGMTASCMEYLRICKAHGFRNVVVSMKSSNVLVMCEAVRQVSEAMDKENLPFPLHLGVTEAGDAEDGRIKSALGIGSLLADGYGDTIRVSLSEDPVAEIPVAEKIRSFIERLAHAPHISNDDKLIYNREYEQRKDSVEIGEIGGDKQLVVVGDLRFHGSYTYSNDFHPDFIIRKEDNLNHVFEGFDEVIELETFQLDHAALSKLKSKEKALIILSSHHPNAIGDWRKAFAKLETAGVRLPVIINRDYMTEDLEQLYVEATIEMGSILMEGRANGLMITAPKVCPNKATQLAFSILQAARLRFTKTEYISCPGCGRTLYDLPSTIKRIKEATSHLPGLKIGIMGCIVNGPGEMADADYGYVGAAKGKVDLYKGKQCVERGIPQEEAVKRLLHLIENDKK